MTREGTQQPGDETRSGGGGAKVEKVESGEIYCMSWADAMELLPRGLHWETQGTFSTLLVPFRNVISERRTLQNKSGEMYRQLVVKKVEKVEKVEKLKSEQISGPKWRKL